MNQILIQKYKVLRKKPIVINDEIIEEPTQKASSNHNHTNFYKFQFIFSSFIASCFLFVFVIRIFSIMKNEKLSKQLTTQYHISTLYSNNDNYSTSLMSSSNNIIPNNSSNYSNPFVIGILKIDKINLNYPILSETSKDLLDISLCRFTGPFPNEVGNLCIAGHNYVDYKLFSRLNELQIKDKIKVYDLNGQMIEYTVFKKYETSPDDISCTSQDTDGNTILTLLTCNNVNGKRLVVVAK